MIGSSKKNKNIGIFDNEIEGLWRYRDAALFLGVSIRTLSRGVKANKVPTANVVGCVRFCPWVLKAWAENGGSL